jgi:hypothetical protein
LIRVQAGRSGCIAVALIAAVGVSLSYAAIARAGYPVQPVGTSVAGQPTFLVYVDDGETLPEVVVASNPDMSGYQGSCYPTTAWIEPHKYTCKLFTSLALGTYYWTFSWWKNDNCQLLLGSTYCYLQKHITASFAFTVVPPTPPADAGLVSPASGAVVGASPTLTIRAPGGATMHIYVSDAAARQSDGSPLGLTLYQCGGTTANDGNYYCTDNQSDLVPGSLYYWWAVIDTGSSAWIYGPSVFRVTNAAGSGSSSGGTASGSSGSTGTARRATDAAYLPASAHFTGRSIHQTRLSLVAYSLSKVLGLPKSMAVACWSDSDWQSVSGAGSDGIYTTLGFYWPVMPHWVQLSPTVCRALETLIYHRPQYPNRFTANAAETLTHEMMHALGIRSEPLAECFGMQLTILLAVKLGVPYWYADRLAHLNLENYSRRPPNYIDRTNCREDGAWDLFKGHPSPPWNSYEP